MRAAAALLLSCTCAWAGGGLLTRTAANAPAPLATPAPYVGQELVHPSVFHRAGGWNGFPYWMAVTPYAHSDAQYENPSLYCSLDGQVWRTPPGLVNPLAARPSLPRRYLSDPHLACGPDGVLRLFYRAAGADRGDTLTMIASADGRRWSAPRIILDVPLDEERQLSPAIFASAGGWVMYYVDSVAYPYVIRRRSAARPEGPWSTPKAVTGIAPPPERMLWHLDAFPCEGGTALLVDCTEIYRTQSGGQLFLATSADGLAFVRAAQPVLSGSAGWDRSIYRSCCVALPGPEGTTWAIWYSAFGPDGWRLGRTDLPPR